jgi:hypothetical protein
VAQHFIVLDPVFSILMSQAQVSQITVLFSQTNTLFAKITQLEERVALLSKEQLRNISRIRVLEGRPDTSKVEGKDEGGILYGELESLSLTNKDDGENTGRGNNNKCRREGCKDHAFNAQWLCYDCQREVYYASRNDGRLVS